MGEFEGGRGHYFCAGSGTFEYEEFCALVQNVEEDEGASEEELRDIFRLFDKEVGVSWDRP